MKRPSFQFYPSDWLRDTALRTCSVGARGLWIDMICYMHQGSPYGYLKVNQKVILPSNLATMCGATLDIVDGWLKELESAGVFSIDESGAIYSRRMIRDEEIRNSRASGGKLGGNPAFKVNHKVIDKVNQNPTPSSSSSSSSITTAPENQPKKEKLKKAPAEDFPIPVRFEEFWITWPSSNRKIGKIACRDKWASKNLDALADKIISHVKVLQASKQWLEGFDPAPMTYINQSRWEDADASISADPWTKAGRKLL